MTFKFKRKRFLLSEKNKKCKSIGYARAIDSEFDYLKEQIKCLKNEGCSLIFSEIISIDEEIKPELRKALNYLSKGDELVVTKLDRAFSNRNECIKTIHKLLIMMLGLELYQVFYLQIFHQRYQRQSLISYMS